MKELEISLKKDTEEERVKLSNDIIKALEEYKKNGDIDIFPREKFRYTEDELDMMCTLIVKLVDPGEKLLGAFVSWFAYKTSRTKLLEDNVYKLGPNVYRIGPFTLNNIISHLTNLTCMMHRIKGVENDYNGFEGNVMVKICDFEPSTFNKHKGLNNIEVEPLPKHAKYFNQFADLNIWDF